MASNRSLEAFEFRVKFALETWPNVCFQHERYARPEGCHGLSGALHNSEDLIPLALNRREHRVGAVRQPRVAHHLHRSGDGV